MIYENERGHVHYLVHRAITQGRLHRQPCEKCGDPQAIAHHDDYSRPLDVRWLCRSHHSLHHAQHPAAVWTAPRILRWEETLWRENRMAKQKAVRVVSDLSGDDIPEGTGAEVRIKFNDASGLIYLLDVTSDEADTWATQGREQKKRGRPKSEPKVEVDEMSLA